MEGIKNKITDPEGSYKNEEVCFFAMIQHGSEPSYSAPVACAPTLSLYLSMWSIGNHKYFNIPPNIFEPQFHLRLLSFSSTTGVTTNNNQ